MPDIPAGEVIHWTFEATNTGDVELTQMAVTANALAVSCPKTVLQPGESMTCTASSHAVAGPHLNVATATGTPPSRFRGDGDRSRQPHGPRGRHQPGEAGQTSAAR